MNPAGNQPEPLRRSASAISSALIDRGIKFLEVEYSGSGDDGGINNILYKGISKKESKDIDNMKISAPTFVWSGEKKAWIDREFEQRVRDAITELFTIILDKLWAGYEIDDGGFGEFQWDLESGECINNHNLRIGTDSLYYACDGYIDEEDIHEYKADYDLSDIKVNEENSERIVITEENISQAKIFQYEEELNFSFDGKNIIFDSQPEDTDDIYILLKNIKGGSYSKKFNINLF